MLSFSDVRSPPPSDSPKNPKFLPFTLLTYSNMNQRPVVVVIAYIIYKKEVGFIIYMQRPWFSDTYFESGEN